jgi:hypothetical protein
MTVEGGQERVKGEQFVIKVPNDQEAHLMPEVVAHSEDLRGAHEWLRTYAHIYPENRIVLADVTAVAQSA